MKGNRQEEILKIIEEKIINTQEELQRELNELGYNVTQSTVSRDIKQLRLIKGHDKNGNYRYINGASGNNSEHAAEHYREIIKRSTVSLDYSFNNVIIKCYSGMAQSVCVAIDNMYSKHMVGSVAGEDTIIIVTRSESDSVAFLEIIKQIL